MMITYNILYRICRHSAQNARKKKGKPVRTDHRDFELEMFKTKWEEQHNGYLVLLFLTTIGGSYLVLPSFTEFLEEKTMVT